MKLKAQMKFIAAAVAVGLSASAHAITVTTSNSGAASFSELILVAYDDTKVGTGIGTTYVRGLGVQMDAFLPNSPLVTNPVVTVNSGAATVFAGGTRTGEGFYNAPLAGDTNWGTFTAAVGSLSDIRWGVVGRKAGTAGVANQYPAAVYTGVAAPNNNYQVGTLSIAFTILMQSANAQGCGGANDSCVTEIDVGSNLGANIIFNGVGTLSETLGFTLAFKNTNLGGSAAFNRAPALSPFCADDFYYFACGSWSINGATGEVLYTAPVPLPAAAWLMVVGLLGMFGMGRRKAARA
ncbi:MAG: VPLPA-CTERM sorting domain-containing protein [Burkholderiales bacterium]